MTVLSTESAARAERMYDRYGYPAWLRTHSRLVGRVATVLAEAAARSGLAIDARAVSLGGFLHDIGRSPLLAGLRVDHNEASAIVLRAEGLGALAELARRHPVYAPLDPALAPRTFEEKVVNLADRRAGLELMTVAERVAEVGTRHPEYAHELARSLAAALALEREVFGAIGLPADGLGDLLRSDS